MRISKVERFKVGDKIRVISTQALKVINEKCDFNYDTWIKVGDRFTIKNIDQGFLYTHEGGGYLWDCFEKVVEDTFEKDGVE
jgi:hypothetical protein